MGGEQGPLNVCVRERFGLTSLLIDGTNSYTVKYAPILQQNILAECKFRFREWDKK
jgi:hypothetical protein